MTNFLAAADQGDREAGCFIDVNEAVNQRSHSEAKFENGENDEYPKISQWNTEDGLMRVAEKQYRFLWATSVVSLPQYYPHSE